MWGRGANKQLRERVLHLRSRGEGEKCLGGWGRMSLSLSWVEFESSALLRLSPPPAPLRISAPCAAGCRPRWSGRDRNADRLARLCACVHPLAWVPSYCSRACAQHPSRFLDRLARRRRRRRRCRHHRRRRHRRRPLRRVCAGA